MEVGAVILSGPRTELKAPHESSTALLLCRGRSGAPESGGPGSGLASATHRLCDVACDFLWPLFLFSVKLA